MNKKSITSEEDWWDQYGSINESLWHYDSYLHQWVRAPYLEVMYQFLYKPNGHLLDFGCGTGWVSLVFAQNGMKVQGIDLSSEQITRAQAIADSLHITGAYYSCGTVDMIKEKAPFDSALVHSLLHHLSEKEKQQLLNTICESLVEGGRLFLYEPMAATNRRSWAHVVFDKGMLALFRLLRFVALLLYLYRPEVDRLERNGWKMISPNEAPLPPEQLFRIIPPDLQITHYRYMQAYSVKYANFCMSLKPRVKSIFQSGVVLFCWLDNLILATPMRTSLSVWPMAIYTLEKRNPKGSKP